MVTAISRQSYGFGCVHEEFSDRILAERTVAVPDHGPWLSFMVDNQKMASPVVSSFPDDERRIS